MFLVGQRACGGKARGHAVFLTLFDHIGIVFAHLTNKRHTEDRRLVSSIGQDMTRKDKEDLANNCGGYNDTISFMHWVENIPTIFCTIFHPAPPAASLLLSLVRLVGLTELALVHVL